MRERASAPANSDILPFSPSLYATRFFAYLPLMRCGSLLCPRPAGSARFSWLISFFFILLLQEKGVWERYFFSLPMIVAMVLCDRGLNDYIAVEGRFFTDFVRMLVFSSCALFSFI